MTPPRLFTFFLLFSLLMISAVHGQSIAHHSFAFSLESGPVRLRHFNQSTGQVGAGLNYQYKFAKFFALRTGLAYRHIAPVKFTEHYHNLEVGEKTYTHSEYNFGYRHFSLQLSPCLYWRQENFALITGFSGAIGNLVQKLQIEDFYNTSANTGQSSPEVTTSRESANTFGYGPMLGFSVPIQGQRVLGEVEISVFYQRWQSPKNLHLSRAARTSSFSYDAYGLQAAYRINF